MGHYQADQYRHKGNPRKKKKKTKAENGLLLLQDMYLHIQNVQQTPVTPGSETTPRP